jgi:hypothetical protein
MAEVCQNTDPLSHHGLLAQWQTPQRGCSLPLPAIDRLPPAQARRINFVTFCNRGTLPATPKKEAPSRVPSTPRPPLVPIGRLRKHGFSCGQLLLLLGQVFEGWVRPVYFCMAPGIHGALAIFVLNTSSSAVDEEIVNGSEKIESFKADAGDDQQYFN